MQSATALLATARRGLYELGYQDRLLQENYDFADPLTDGAVKQIPLAAFGQEPLSYRTACLGVTIAQDDHFGDPRSYRALGAPQILMLHPDQVSRWKMTATGAPALLERFPSDRLLEVLRRRRAEWEPASVLRAKSVAFGASPIQLDFYDAGLVPTIEAVVRAKLDVLIQQTISATSDAYFRAHQSAPDYAGLFRLIFRLLAAKVFADRQYPGTWLYDDAAKAITAVENFYFRERPVDPALRDPSAQAAAWEHIRSGFHFQNISMETLAYVYENTLVSPQLRRRQSIHSTPPAIAEYMVRQLPFEVLQEEERRVFEPFSGHGTFLIAALGRLRGLLGPGVSGVQRHDYLKRMLAGMEQETFANEVACLALMLADYPNPNGWRLLEGDVYRDPRLPAELKKARVVLCNPPFERFSDDERSSYPDPIAPSKAVEALTRVLQQPPDLLGFVLPRAFRDGQSYRPARHQLVDTYEQLELVELPDTAFTHSSAETILLLAHGHTTGTLRLRAATVRKPDYERFLHTGEPSSKAESILPVAEAARAPALWVSALERVWQALAEYPNLGTVADVHRGIEYNVPLAKNLPELVSTTPRPGFVSGLARVTDRFEPYIVPRHVYLNTSPELMLYAVYRLPWSRPKVIANAAPRSRGPWRLVAIPDPSGLVCYQRFHAIWAKAAISPEVIAAVLNGPVANAFIGSRDGKRDNRVQTIASVPVPQFSARSMQMLQDLVRDYRRWREEWRQASEPATTAEQGRRLLLEIDAEVLAAYDLPPRLEREVLRWFAGEQRPVPIPFTDYYPPGFRPALPLRLLIAPDLEDATVRKTLERLPVLRDPAISAFVTTLDAES